jgi:uncharacterized membrane protein SirB2
MLKLIHVASVGLSLALFFLRGVWMLKSSPWLRQSWVKVAPHVNDTLLLLSGVALAIRIQQYPPYAGWLNAKLGALLVYILLGMVALKWGRSRAERAAAWVCALLVFGYMVSVAATRSPFGFFGY